MNTNKNVVISTGRGGKISHHTAYRLANDADFFYTLSNIPAY